jgi:hypothetical protein
MPPMVQSGIRNEVEEPYAYLSAYPISGEGINLLCPGAVL